MGFFCHYDVLSALAEPVAHNRTKLTAYVLDEASLIKSPYCEASV